MEEAAAARTTQGSSSAAIILSPPTGNASEFAPFGQRSDTSGGTSCSTNQVLLRNIVDFDVNSGIKVISPQAFAVQLRQSSYFLSSSADDEEQSKRKKKQWAAEVTLIAIHRFLSKHGKLYSPKHFAAGSYARATCQCCYLLSQLLPFLDAPEHLDTWMTKKMKQKDQGKEDDDLTGLDVLRYLVSACVDIHNLSMFIDAPSAAVTEATQWSRCSVCSAALEEIRTLLGIVLETSSADDEDTARPGGGTRRPISTMKLSAATLFKNNPKEELKPSAAELSGALRRRILQIEISDLKVEADQQVSYVVRQTEHAQQDKGKNDPAKQKSWRVKTTIDTILSMTSKVAPTFSDYAGTKKHYQCAACDHILQLLHRFEKSSRLRWLLKRTLDISANEMVKPKALQELLEGLANTLSLLMAHGTRPSASCRGCHVTYRYLVAPVLLISFCEHGYEMGSPSRSAMEGEKPALQTDDDAARNEAWRCHSCAIAEGDHPAVRRVACVKEDFKTISRRWRSYIETLFQPEFIMG